MINIFQFLKKDEKANVDNNVKMEEVLSIEDNNTKEEINPIEETIKESSNNQTEDNPLEKDNNKKHKKLLLVVDDNKLNLRVASKLLGDLNCDIETVQSGKECIEKIEENKKYDLVLMDIMMPEMDGVETMHKIKSMPGFNAPVVSLTADAVEGSREKYLKEGFDEYISKPMNLEEIKETIQKCIDDK